MNSIPGYREGRSVTPRKILLSEDHKLYIQGVMVSTAYDGANTNYEDEIRAGWLMGRVTATGKWRPCPRTQVNGSSGAVTSLIVDNAAAFVAGDTITIGSDTGVAVSAVNYSTNTLTIASTTVADNEVVFAEDGSATARAILDEFVKLKSLDDATRRDRTISRLLIAGFVNEDMVLGDLAAVRAVLSSMYLGGILWGDYQGYQS